MPTASSSTAITVSIRRSTLSRSVNRPALSSATAIRSASTRAKRTCSLECRRPDQASTRVSAPIRRSLEERASVMKERTPIERRNSRSSENGPSPAGRCPGHARRSRARASRRCLRRCARAARARVRRSAARHRHACGSAALTATRSTRSSVITSIMQRSASSGTQSWVIRSRVEATEVDAVSYLADLVEQAEAAACLAAFGDQPGRVTGIDRGADQQRHPDQVVGGPEVVVPDAAGGREADDEDRDRGSSPGGRLAGL